MSINHQTLCNIIHISLHRKGVHIISSNYKSRVNEQIKTWKVRFAKTMSIFVQCLRYIDDQYDLFNMINSVEIE